MIFFKIIIASILAIIFLTIKKIEIKEEVSINLKERLEDIKRLILMHQDKKADKMLSELEQEKNNMNKKEKQILLQFQKNKKLYRSRR